jgi:hypothetical protein
MEPQHLPPSMIHTKNKSNCSFYITNYDTLHDSHGKVHFLADEILNPNISSTCPMLNEFNLALLFIVPCLILAKVSIKEF